MMRLRILTLCSILIASAIFFFQKENQSTITAKEGLVVDKAWLATNANPLTPKMDVRAPDQTFLTFPEWYLVFSPEEQAKYFESTTATTFPYMIHTKQIWDGYKIVNDQIKDNFPVNTGYHFMIWVIGTSTSLEYIIKACYETIIGRITDTRQVITDEDRFAAKYTQEYVTFIKDRPWYEFEFQKRLQSFWTTTALFGDNFLRKIERRYFITTELIAKLIYGKLIGLGTSVVYEEALMTTAVIVNSATKENLHYTTVKHFPDSSMLMYLPRYDKFNAAISELAKNGCSFKEIAGNNSAILLTVIVPDNYSISLNNVQILFRQTFPSNPRSQRIALVIPVPQLNALLKQLDSSKITVEHVFDY